MHHRLIPTLGKAEKMKKSPPNVGKPRKMMKNRNFLIETAVGSKKIAIF